MISYKNRFRFLSLLYHLYISYPIIAILLFCSFFFSCTIENKIARSFVNNRKALNVLILKPDYLYKENLRDDSIANLSSLSKVQKDSILIGRSLFLKSIDDSLFVDLYFRSILNELKLYGINVFSDSSVDKFYKSDSLSHIFNIAQVQLDESLVPYDDKILLDTAVYVQSFVLNMVALATWFETTELNSYQNKTLILFAEHSASDKIRGSFHSDILGDNIYYKYKRNDITLDDVYSLASFSGKTNAAYIFDFLLNNHISTRLKKLNRNPASSYFHFNRTHNFLAPAGNNRFSVME